MVWHEVVSAAASWANLTSVGAQMMGRSLMICPTARRARLTLFIYMINYTILRNRYTFIFLPVSRAWLSVPHRAEVMGGAAMIGSVASRTGHDTQLNLGKTEKYNGKEVRKDKDFITMKAHILKKF